jgi:acetyl/propionyl-CoA carboxylase alpha subunit
MERAGVPVVPGATPADQSNEGVLAAVRTIGLPCLVKASAGGGGKGMRSLRDEADAREMIEGARREAQAAFGDGTLYVERLIERPRHVEIQVFGDAHGHVVHLFERECSVQRRHQKIVEETPSPLLTPQLRAHMGDAAVAAAKAVGYTNAGTVEFILDPGTMDFYFLEMNTRLQVEHPVTELVTGIDLVHWQIRVAAGEPLPFTQSESTQRGHAIECRVYAEDPANGFLPSTGKLLQYVEPHGPGIRVDSGFTAGDEVTHFYDPLLAKLIVHAEDRKRAIQRMQAALQEFIVHGVITNIDFLQAVLRHPDFANGEVTTRWVETTLESGSSLAENELQAPSLHLIAAALADLTTAGRQPKSENQHDPDRYSPWNMASGFRIGGSHE